MSAPRSIHQTAQRRATLIVEREYQPDQARCVAAIVKLLTYRPPAASRVPPMTAAQKGSAYGPMQHEDRACALQDVDAAFMEDGRHEQSTDN